MYLYSQAVWTPNRDYKLFLHVLFRLLVVSPTNLWLYFLTFDAWHSLTKTTFHCWCLLQSPTQKVYINSEFLLVNLSFFDCHIKKFEKSFLLSFFHCETRCFYAEVNKWLVKLLLHLLCLYLLICIKDNNFRDFGYPCWAQGKVRNILMFFLENTILKIQMLYFFRFT